MSEHTVNSERDQRRGTRLRQRTNCSCSPARQRKRRLSFTVQTLFPSVVVVILVALWTSLSCVNVSGRRRRMRARKVSVFRTDVSCLPSSLLCLSSFSPSCRCSQSCERTISLTPGARTVASLTTCPPICLSPCLLPLLTATTLRRERRMENRQFDSRTRQARPKPCLQQHEQGER